MLRPTPWADEASRTIARPALSATRWIALETSPMRFCPTPTYSATPGVQRLLGRGQQDLLPLWPISPTGKVQRRGVGDPSPSSVTPTSR